MIKPYNMLYIACGIILGLLLFIYPSSIFYLAVLLITRYFLNKNLPDAERPFILYVFFFALSLRLILIMITHALSSCPWFGVKSYTFPGMEGGGFLGDDIGIHLRAWALSNVAKGIHLPQIQTKVLLKFKEYGWTFHIYVLGFIYYLFGAVPLLGKCLNAFFGVLTGVTVYFIARELFGLKVARLAYVLTVFYPTLFFWSLVNLKDTLLIFLMTSCALFYVLFQKFRQIRYLLLILLLFFFIEVYREGSIFILIFVLFASFLINIKWNFKKVIVAGVLGLAILITGNIFNKYTAPINYRINRKIRIGQLVLQQRGSFATGGSTYKIFPGRFYCKSDYIDMKPISRTEFILSSIQAIISFVLKPFPWEIDQINKAVFFPISVIYGILFFFFVIGLLVSLRYNFRRSIFLILLCTGVLVFLSLTSGNIGTMIRIRDTVTPIYIIFSSVGIVHLLFRKESGEAK